MKKQLFALTLIVSVLLYGCTDPINKKISKETFNDDVKSIKEKHAKDYTDADFVEFRESLANKLAAQVLGFNKDENITYKQILDTVKAQRERDEAEIKSYNDAVAEVAKKVSLQVDSFRYTADIKYSSYQVNVRIINNTAKNITAFKGVIVLKNKAGEKIGAMQHAGDEGINIAANSSLAERFGTGIEPTDNDAQLSTLKLSEITFVWMPQIIIFSDGSKLAAPEKPLALLKKEQK